LFFDELGLVTCLLDDGEALVLLDDSVGEAL
jgi:hypothetical protein